MQSALNYLNQPNAAVTLSLASKTVLILLELIVGLIIGSVSVIADAIHSSTGLLAAVLASFVLHNAARTAAANPPYGHAQSARRAAALIFLAAGLIVFEAVRRLYYGAVVRNPDWGIAAMAFSALVNFLVSQHLFNAARSTESPALAVNVRHSRRDLRTALGVGSGLLIGRLADIPQLDPLVAIGVGLFIVKAAWDMTRGAAADAPKGDST